MLTIETIDGLTAIRCPGTNKVWVFDGADEARRFIGAWFSHDVRYVA